MKTITVLKRHNHESSELVLNIESEVKFNSSVTKEDRAGLGNGCAGGILQIIRQWAFVKK